MDSLNCRSFREAALEADAPREHARECSACAQWLRRFEQREGVLRSLPRQLAPESLGGRVVAAIQAGERQARAVRALQGLGRLEQPAQLEQRVQDEVAGEAAEKANEPLQALAGRQLAPAVLDRLVAEELSDPSKARVARFAGSVPRLKAPAELEQRVAEELARPARRNSGSAWWIAAAAALVLATLAPIWILGESRVRPFRVEYTDSFASMSPMSRGLLESASSGMFGRAAAESDASGAARDSR
jgi:hypothetical protein